MTPTAPATWGQMISVHTPPLVSTVGYVTVDGFWQETGRPATRWRERRTVVTAWTPIAKPVGRNWET